MPSACLDINTVSHGKGTSLRDLSQDMDLLKFCLCSFPNLWQNVNFFSRMKLISHLFACLFCFQNCEH
ncbi:hypothetical protein Nmel_011611 [Mimus melanotis]